VHDIHFVDTNRTDWTVSTLMGLILSTLTVPVDSVPFEMDSEGDMNMMAVDQVDEGIAENASHATAMVDVGDRMVLEPAGSIGMDLFHWLTGTSPSPGSTGADQPAEGRSTHHSIHASSSSSSLSSPPASHIDLQPTQHLLELSRTISTAVAMDFDHDSRTLCGSRSGFFPPASTLAQSSPLPPLRPLRQGLVCGLSSKATTALVSP
jgi:hypothetical protein